MPPHTTRVTINEVARVAGVSKATVSRVLNSRPVNEAYRQKVLEAIHQLNYQPNVQARGLPLGRSYMIGVITPVIANLFFASIIHGIEQVLVENGYSMVVMSTFHKPDRELSFVRLVTERRVDGVLLVTPRQADSRMLEQYVANSGTPLVLIDAESPLGLVSAVTVDNRSGGRIATEHLLQLGHRRIGVITGPANVPETIARLEGYKDAMAAAGLTPDPAWIQHGDYSPESAQDGVPKLLELPASRRPTAIFAFNDFMALTALAMLEERGVAVPQAMSVVGYDDAYAEVVSRPRLTTVRQPLEQLGQIGARKLLKTISGEEPEPLRMVLPVRLMIRESTAPPPTSDP